MSCLNCKCSECVRARSEWPKDKPKPPWTRYPWDKWFDGSVHTLVRGVDFECSPERMRCTVYETAARKGFRPHARVSGDTVKIWVDGRRRVPYRCLSVSKQRAVAAGCEE